MPQISDIELTRLKQAVEELTTLNRIANAINVTMSIESISSVIVDHCCKRIGAAQGAIFLLETDDAEADRFKTFVRETSADPQQIPFHLNVSLQGWMVKNKAILVSNSPQTDERLRGVDFTRLGVQTLIAAPLLSRRGLIGILVLINKRSEAGFDELDKRFVGIVGTQVAKVIENAKLFEKETRLAAVEKELRVARTIQEGFLPKDKVITPGSEVVGFSAPAREVGGDYYDMLQISPDCVFISIGDIAGKGMPAALLTGNALAVLRSQLHRAKTADLTAFAECLNNLICQFTGPEQYITALFGVFDGSTRRLRYVNAGHLPPIILRSSGRIEKPLQADLVIGVIPDVPFNVVEIGLDHEETVLLYTDGITEAYNEAQEQFGEERLETLLSNHRSRAPAELCDEIQKEVSRFRGSAEQSDDITMLVLKVH
ncbi:MAG TPA: GAF domain-containing SpoIIE family protein phosphatase [Candidatus Deferrimicrobium sp.]|nr:GAF domain-containing SpoIIE family protein phosphatase [Candidatus Deferrimicrobium sp.]